MTTRRGVGPLSGAMALLGLAGVWTAPAAAADCAHPVFPTIHDLPNPPELVSEHGELRGTLTIAPAEITVRGCKVVSNVIDGDYLAPALNRLARLLAAGHGRQILVTETVRSLLDGASPDGSSLRDLGEHRLRDLQQPERIWQAALARRGTDL